MKLNVLKRGVLSVLCLAFLFGLAGCGGWETTKKIYQGAILPAQIDLEQNSGLSANEQKMARLFKEIDQHIEDLTRDLLVQESLPDQDWMRSHVSRFSWLNGVLAWNRQGDLVGRYPEQAIKQPDLEALQTTNATSVQSLRALSFQVQASELGPEIVVIRPLYQAAELSGNIAAHFDPRTLASLSEQPREIIIFTPGHLLWDGENQEVSQELTGIDWEHNLEHKTAGQVEIQDKAYYWIARYIGDKPLFYAVETVD